ncbi:MAG: hypothetical protein JWR22_3725 [Herminiimonas sp.]|nr:hypothetical protein [Herminiimonas sp.]
MADKETYDRYAIEMAQRFAAFVTWAKENWPDQNFPLLDSDFDNSRKEIRLLLGERLESCQQDASSNAGQDATQYIDVTPSPWP